MCFYLTKLEIQTQSVKLHDLKGEKSHFDFWDKKKKKFNFDLKIKKNKTVGQGRELWE